MDTKQEELYKSCGNKIGYNNSNILGDSKI